MISLGVDPARGATGLAVVEVDPDFKPHLLHSEVVRAKSGETMRASRERIVTRSLAVFDAHKCEMAGMECATVGTKEDLENPQTYKQLLIDKARNLRSLQVQARIVGAIETKLEERDILVVHFENAAHWRKKVGIIVGPYITREMLKAAAIEQCFRLFGVLLTDDEAEAALAGWAATMIAVEEK